MHQPSSMSARTHETYAVTDRAWSHGAKRNHVRASLIASLPAVSSGYHQRVTDAGPPQAAAQLVEQAVSQGLQRQHYQQSAEKQAVGGLQKKRKTLLGGGDTLLGSYTIRDGRRTKRD